MVTEARKHSITTLTKIEVGQGIQLYITQDSNDLSLVVKADENLQRFN